MKKIIDLDGDRFVYRVEHNGKNYYVGTVSEERIESVKVAYRRESALGWTEVWQHIPMNGPIGKAVIAAFIDNVTADDGRNPDGSVA